MCNLYEKLQLAQKDDLIHIENNTNTFDKIERISYINNYSITTKNYQFSKSSFQCITPDFSNLFIKDVYFNLSRNIKNFFIKKKFILTSSEFENKHVKLKKELESGVIKIEILNKTELCLVGITYDNLILFLGDIEKVSELDIIYKCVLRKIK